MLTRSKVEYFYSVFSGLRNSVCVLVLLLRQICLESVSEEDKTESRILSLTSDFFIHDTVYFYYI